MDKHINGLNDLQLQPKDNTIKENGKVIKPDFDFSGIAKQDIKGEAERLLQQSKADANRAGMFRIRTGNQCQKDASLMPDPVELYPHLMIEGEITILFADTGIGKTVLAVQMAVEIAKRYTVLYLDLELSDKQFEKRYKDNSGNHYVFPENFYRVDYTPRFEAPDGIDYDRYFIQSLKEAIKKTGAKIVVIDNMTKLTAGDTDTAKATIPIMNELSKLKFDDGITFLVLEHNKKVDNTRPISLNDLQGSKMKSNFADAVFTIGRSHSDKNIRYVKQLKVRAADIVYDTENVAVYQITKDDTCLRFEPIGFKSEYELLMQPTEESRAEIVESIKELHQKGRSLRDIGRELGISHMKVKRVLDSL